MKEDLQNSFLNGLNDEFRSMIMIMVTSVVVPKYDFFEVGKLLINEKTGSVYEKMNNQTAICEKIVPVKVIKGNEETIFILNVVSKGKISATQAEVVVNTKSHAREFCTTIKERYATPVTKMKSYGKFKPIELELLNFSVNCFNDPNSKNYRVSVSLNLGYIHAGELCCQISKSKYTEDQACSLARCALISAYSTIIFLTETSENELVDKNREESFS
jgi:hypothetical protein